MSAAEENRTAKAERKGHPLSALRMTGLETAASMLGGQAHLAAAIGIDPRSLRAKLAAGRGIADLDLTLTATALHERAARIAAHAEKLRAMADATTDTSSTRGTS
jgi:hypothetical protein